MCKYAVPVLRLQMLVNSRAVTITFRDEAPLSINTVAHLPNSSLLRYRIHSIFCLLSPEPSDISEGSTSAYTVVCRLALRLRCSRGSVQGAVAQRYLVRGQFCGSDLEPTPENRQKGKSAGWLGLYPSPSTAVRLQC